MLAEPKRKTVWSLNPRGKYWSEDKSKIGQKLLESMGWREGLGLGKNNNGIRDNIKLNINSDNKGLGYKTTADSVWIDKNDDYEQLLANLAVHHNIDHKNSWNQSKPKVSNLSETSKKIRNRLNYNKFIESKNLSKYSEKDFLSIFPKKSLNSNQRNASENTTESNCIEEVDKTENTFESTTNMNDYFKSKMDKMKLKYQLNKIDSIKVDENEDQNEESVTEDNTFENPKRKAQELSEGSDESIDNLNTDLNKKKKSKKKNKRNKEEKAEQNPNILESPSNSESESQHIQQNSMKKEKPNKKHKSKKMFVSDETLETDSVSSNDSKKSKKNNKLKTDSIAIPKGYNSNNMSVTESLKNYHKICSAIGKDKALRTTNLMSLKGYGGHSHHSH